MILEALIEKAEPDAVRRDECAGQFAVQGLAVGRRVGEGAIEASRSPVRVRNRDQSLAIEPGCSRAARDVGVRSRDLWQRLSQVVASENPGQPSCGGQAARAATCPVELHRADGTPSRVSLTMENRGMPSLSVW